MTSCFWGWEYYMGWVAGAGFLFYFILIFLSGIVFLWSIRLRELIPGWFRLKERLHP